MPEVELPELGESVTEGIILEWLVEVGDEVEEDQPIVEISTDKVDTEIPSPTAGVVEELRAEVDEIVEVGQVLAVIGAREGGERPGGTEEPAAGAAGEREDIAAEAQREQRDEAGEAAPAGASAAEPGEPAEQAPAGEGETAQPATRPAAASRQAATAGAGGNGQTGAGVLTSPLVRKMLRQAGLGPQDVRATGEGGRITRADAERAIAAGGEAAPGAAGQPAPAARPGPSARVQRVPPRVRPDGGRPEPSPLQIEFGDSREVTQDLSRVRRAIANAMHTSLQTTAQLTAAVEADVTGIMNLRAAVKDDFKATYGVSLSPLPFMARAVCMTIPRHPAINGSIDTDEGTATFRRYINLGIAVDTERGLLVPNIKDAQDLTVPGLTRAISDLATRTRRKQISPDDIQGGTFTITNTGSRGTLFDTPILNPPEVAILATCAIEKRPVVISDDRGEAIAIRWMTYLCLTYDHRMIDGADAARFLQDLKWVLENHDFASEVGV